MNTPAEPIASFAYQAQTRDGQPLSGTLEAPDIEDATRRLESLQLRIVEIHPASRPPRPKGLGGEDFLAFNQQLAQLTSVGLPLEQGLRLMAEDMRSGRLSQTIREIAGELEAGSSIGDALEKHRGKFPSFYARLVEAGVKSNNLPGMLLNLTRHMEMTRRLRAALWRAAAYPLMVMVGIGLVLTFLGMFVLPQFRVFLSVKPIFTPHPIPESLPLPTQILAMLANATPSLAAGIVVAAALGVLFWSMLRSKGREGTLLDRVVLPLPLIGPVFCRSMLAAWCDALRMGVEAGVDLPAAIALASDASTSPALIQDGREMIARLEQGSGIESPAPASVLPATVFAAMALGIEHHNLPETLRSLSEMYEQQAETRLALLPGIISPLLLIGLAVIIGFIIFALMMPLFDFIRSFTSL